MINRKCHCENEVSCQKFVVLKSSISEKVALVKKYSHIEKKNCTLEVEILKK